MPGSHERCDELDKATEIQEESSKGSSSILYFSFFTYYSHIIYRMYQYRREKGTWDRLFDGSCVVFLETAQGLRP